MKVSLNWLRELVDLPPTVDELVTLLTMAGVEVEGIETTGCAIPNVVVAEVKSSEQHPNADRLSVCQVDDGLGTLRQIVCGAKNYKVGDKVLLALPGAKLGPDFTIKVGKLRGVESQGMMCSADELGLPATAGYRGAEDGLLILKPDTRLGIPISDVFPGDTVLDLEITPNRPDLLSMVGIAREVATLTGKKLKLPGAIAGAFGEFPGNIQAEVNVEDPVLCPLYTVRKIDGVRIGRSPEWLRLRLEASGLRPINSVVDITNYVMLELGQPLHAFDAAKLAGNLNVRRAKEGETFPALDGKSYNLSADHLVIADSSKAVAIAGVMGGEDTGVTDATTSVWLESALFQPQSVRRTSRALGLSSDSSYRFERGVDSSGVVPASNRAAKLIEELSGGVISAKFLFPKGAEFFTRRRMDVRRSGGVVESYPESDEAAVQLRPERLKALLGVEVPQERIDAILRGFGLEKTTKGWRSPSFRPDLTREVDLIEEVARVIRMDAVPSRVQARFSPASASDRAYDRAMELRRALVAQGLHEARSLTLVPTHPLGLAATQTSTESLQRVKNPMIDDQVVLRPNLLHGLLTAVRDNIRAGARSVRLFEIGRAFSTRKPEEFSHAAIVITGPKSDRTWRSPEGTEIDLFDLKGILTVALGSATTFEKDTNEGVALSLSVKVNGKPVGFAGQLWPAEARSLDADAPVVFAEIDLDALAKAESTSVAKRYNEIPRFPAVTRDIAMLAPLDLAHEAITTSLVSAKEPLLVGAELFDVFVDPTGAKIPSDKKSLAYSLTYRSAERTLTADEVNAAHAKLKQKLVSECKVALRE
jgi:phenylalanyl-tRNA synthetase beta chain